MKILKLFAIALIFFLLPGPAFFVGLADAAGEALRSPSTPSNVALYNDNTSDAVNSAPELSALNGRGRSESELLREEKEKLYFDIYWMGIYVGNATLEGVRRDGRITLTSEVHSAPVISVVYKVEDHATSSVVNGRPVNFRIRQREGRYRSDKETLFNTADGKLTYIDYRKGLRAVHEIKKPLWDVISGFYYLRTLLLETGKTLSLDVFDSNKVLKTEVHVLRKEKISFPGEGEVDAFVVKPELRTEGLFKHKGDILIWLTGDERRIPVRVETRVSIGKVVAELKRVEIVR